MNREYDKAASRAPIELAGEADFTLGRLIVLPSSCEIGVNGNRRGVEPRVMQALVALAHTKGRVVSREELIQRCWGGRIVGEDAINRCIAKVRKLADLDAGASFTLETIPRVGYRLNEFQPAKDGSDLGAGSDTSVPRPPANAFRKGIIGKPWLVAGVIALTSVTVTALTLWLAYPDGGERLETRTLPPQNPSQIAAAKSLPPAGSVFRDCVQTCPEMVVIPAGTFLMGSAYNEPGRRDDELPQHRVTIARPFAVSKFEITRKEYAAFATDTGRPVDDGACFTLTREGRFIETQDAGWRNPGFAQSSRDPAVCVNWDDADAYANWLSRKTGKPYRLLSEAEWEYSGRAGTIVSTAKPGDPRRLCRFLNGGDADYHARHPDDPAYHRQCHDGYVYTSPVGRFPANAFGLFDMLGNAGEWTRDCYHHSYDGTPVDGSAYLAGGCDLRVTRGGSWTDDSAFVRLARRGAGAPMGRFSGTGFRVARTL